jgi:hypothetical protein
MIGNKRQAVGQHKKELNIGSTLPHVLKKFFISLKKKAAKPF